MNLLTKFIILLSTLVLTSCLPPEYHLPTLEESLENGDINEDQNKQVLKDFPLPAGHFIPAKMPMHVVYPRPDSETQNHARHRWAHSKMNYEVPIGVQGGAWPFKYQLIEGPYGAKIGEDYGAENYGVITWRPTKSYGSARFVVQVTDQELNRVNIEWNVTINDSAFIFIQDGYKGQKLGTIDSPLEDIRDWYRDDNDDKKFHNKIVVFRGGNYKLLGDPANKYNVRLLASTKTPSLIAFPGEKPVVDCSEAKILTDNKSMKDLFIAGIKWINGRQDVSNAHFFWAVGDVTRATWWRNHFDNLGPGKKGNDNTGAVFVSGTGTLKKNLLYKQNLHTNIRNEGYNGHYAEWYVTSYLLVEENIARNSNSQAGFFAKGTVSHVTMRANEMWENVTGGQIAVGYGGEARSVPHHHEVCWNKVMLTEGTSNAVTAFKWSSSNYYSGQTYQSFIYRNTFVNGSSWVRFKGMENFEVDANVVVTGNESRWNTNIMDTMFRNLVGESSDNLVDENGEVLDPHLMGQVGHKVYISK